MPTFSTPPVARLTYTADEVAAVLGLSPDYFRLRRPILEARGFPPRLPELSGRWSRFAVDQWIARNGESDPPPAAPGAAIVSIETRRAALEARYGGEAS